MHKLVSVFAILCFAMGCASGGEQKTAANTPEKPAAQDAYSKPAASTPTAGESAQPASGMVIQLTGKMGCGHCNFQIGETCSAAMQTADGKIYVIDGVAEDSELFKNRMSGKEITVAGVVKEVGGVAHIDAKSIM